MFKRFLALVLALTALASCATAPSSKPPAVQQRVRVDALPEALGQQGLLVGAIAGQSIALGTFQELSLSMPGVQIDGTLYTNAVRHGYLVLPLNPGSYTLEALHIHLRIEDRAATLLPLRYKFRIEAGRATNLGVIALLPQQGKPSRYWRLRADNSADMAAYLRRRHAKLAAGLRPAEPVLSDDTKYVDANLLETVRREIARRAWASGEDPGTAQYVGGEVGTIARLLRDTQGKVAAFDVLETGTTAAMVSCSGAGERFVCSSAEPALYFVKGGKVERRDLPINADHAWVHAFGARGLVLVDPYMNVYTSTNDGASWSKHVWYARKKALHPLASIKFANGRSGYYLYANFNLDPLAPEVLYSDYGRAAYRRIAIPKLKNWQRLIETPQGLLVGPYNPNSATERSRLYLRRGAQSEWQARDLPGARCFFLQRDTTGAESLRVYCDSKFYRTQDGARAWTPQAQAAGK